MHRILIVDDEKDITTSLTQGLTNHGFEVVSYNDSEKALSEFESGRYDLALLDFAMPKMNGYDLFRELRASDDKIKICFLSARETLLSEFQRLFPNLPRQCFIRKPVTLRLLVDHIESELKPSSN